MRTSGLVFALGLSLMTAGCTAEGPDPETSTSAPAITDRTPDPMLSTTSGPGADLVGRFEVQIPVDAGPRDYATGTTTFEDGVPVAYEVASGDIVDYIAERFGLEGDPPANEGFSYLNTINQVRRGGYPWTLHPGDILNLSAYHITSIGSINGEVLAEEPPDPMPPQR